MEPFQVIDSSCSPASPNYPLWAAEAFPLSRHGNLMEASNGGDFILALNKTKSLNSLTGNEHYLRLNGACWASCVWAASFLVDLRHLTNFISQCVTDEKDMLTVRHGRWETMCWSGPFLAHWCTLHAHTLARELCGNVCAWGLRLRQTANTPASANLDGEKS